MSLLSARWSYVTAGAVILTWLALSATLASHGAFRTPSSDPPLPMLLAILLPPLAFGAAVAGVPRFRRWVLGIDPVFLTAVHGLRILGGGFLFLYAFGILPGVFAMPAGWGDILIAVLAPFAAAKLAADSRFLRSPVLKGFHYLGLLDFVGAVGSGLLARQLFAMGEIETTTTALGMLPLSLVPAFAVPLWICFHMAAILQIREAQRLGPSSSI